MAIVAIYSLLFALVMSVEGGTIMEPSIARSVFLPREFDPYCDDYLETITRMSLKDLMSLPKLSDAQVLDQMNRGIYTIPTSHLRTVSTTLFNPNADEQLEYHTDMEGEWEDLMTGGPATINYMGVVMAVASKKDFSLTPNFTYIYIKYPNSFHATLVQVANEMYRALFGAHTSMEKIQVNMRQIPTLLKTALRLITQSSNRMIKAMLPRTLTNLGQYANDSATVAQASFARFEDLTNLLHELVEVSTLTNKDNRDIAEQIANETQQWNKEKENVDAAVASLAAEQERARKDLEDARAKYHAAMLNVPGGQWNDAAWHVYAAHRPAQTCSGRWIFRKCRSLRDQQFAEYSAEAKRKAQEALDILKRAEERSKELFDKQLDKQDDLGVAMNNLAQLNFNELSINETIRVLLSAMEHISKVQGQWSRLSRFFTKIAIDAEHAQKVILESFIGVIDDAESIGEPLDPIEQTLYTELLVETATDIDRDSHLLFLMAKTYYDVSSEYMVDQIASISGLLVIQTDAERDAFVKDVAIKTKVTSDKVKALATERQRVYALASLDRQDQYLEFIKQATIQEGIDNLEEIGIGKR